MLVPTKNTKGFRYYYDETNDVLTVRFSKPERAFDWKAKPGFFIRFNARSGEVTGLAIHEARSFSLEELDDIVFPGKTRVRRILKNIQSISRQEEVLFGY